MNWVILLDLFLVVVLVFSVVRGYRAGLLRTAAGLIGLVAGGVAAVFVVPWVIAVVPDSAWRVPSALASIFVLLVVGSMLGTAIGRVLRRGARAVKLGWLDRILGAAGNLLVTVFVMLLVATGLSAMGVPVLSPALAQSRVLGTIDALAPAPAKSLLAQVRVATFDQGVPWLLDVIGGPSEAPQLPAGDLDTPELARAAASVVRITGAAYECGATMSGSGFVVAPNRIVTNAHVVAGVDAPVIEAPGQPAVEGQVVAFDPGNDLAVIAVEGLQTAALPLAAPPVPGALMATAGYPFGGPFQVRPAEVMSTGPLRISTGGAESMRDVMTLAAQIDHGNSGGPVLTESGAVGGVVFAKSESVDRVGFAVPVQTLEPLAAAAPQLTSTVDSGSCVR